MTDEFLMLPGPTNVDEKVLEATSRPMIGHRGAEWHKMYAEVQDGLKYLFQTENTVYTLTSSGTGAVECAVSNLTKKGDGVLIPVNGEFGSRMADMYEVYGANVTRVTSEWGDTVNLDEIEEKLEKDKNIKILSFVYNETSTGIRNPAKKLAEIGNKYGVIVVCDAISNLGGDEMYMDKWGVDVLITGSQKAIACPPGLAFISVNNKAWKKIDEAEPHINYYWNLRKIDKFHQKSETPFTPAVSLFFGLNEALKIIKEEGIENRVKRHQICSKALRDSVKSFGLKLFPKKEEYASVTVNAFYTPDGMTDSEIKTEMREKYGISISGGFGPTKGKVIRIGTMGVVNKKQITTTVEALGNILSSKGLNIDIEKAKQIIDQNFEK